MINYTIDIIIIVIILLFIFIFAGKGLTASILKSCSWLISIIAAYFLYPIVSGIIRKTFIFDGIREFIYGVMNLDSLAVENGSGQIAAIDSLMLPEGLKSMLVYNRVIVIYKHTF